MTNKTMMAQVQQMKENTKINSTLFRNSVYQDGLNYVKELLETTGQQPITSTQIKALVTYKISVIELYPCLLLIIYITSQHTI